MSFPSTEGLSRSEDGSEFIYGGSVGLNRILGNFQSYSMLDASPRWSAYLLNMFTVFRNAYNPKLTDMQNAQMISQDCEYFLLYLDSYLEALPLNQRSKTKPVVFYVPHYDRLPLDIVRNTPKVVDMLSMFYKLMPSCVPLQSGQVSQSEYTTRFVLQCPKMELPQVTLAAWLRSYAMQNQSGYKWNDQIFMFTHSAMDLHLCNRVPGVTLVESYTGATKYPKDFGTKLSVSAKDLEAYPDLIIPFNTVTHRAFGDPLLIKPLVVRNMKKALLEKANDKKWYTRTTDSIISDIKEVTGIKASELVKIRF